MWANCNSPLLDKSSKTHRQNFINAYGFCFKFQWLKTKFLQKIF
ncbi:hypothetical protein [Moraxella lacunata]